MESNLTAKKFIKMVISMMVNGKITIEMEKENEFISVINIMVIG
jgi:hypothetical protein